MSFEGDLTQWKPNGTDLSQAVNMLHILGNPTHPEHTQTMQSLQLISSNVSFALNMMHIFGHGSLYQQLGVTVAMRQLAGLITKNYVCGHLMEFPFQAQQLLINFVLSVLNDYDSNIRRTAAIVVSKIAELFPIESWGPQMLPSLFRMLDVALIEQYADAVDGSLQAIRRICEDSVHKLSMDSVTCPLDVLVPKLLSLMTCPDYRLRLNAIESYNSILFVLDLSDIVTDNETASVYNNRTLASFGRVAHPLRLHMLEYIRTRGTLTGDSSAEVCRI
jgi:hypothetical protein